jgi:Beta-lactamase enzyme family
MTFFSSDAALTACGQEILQAALQKFPGLNLEQIALTWLVYAADAPILTGGSLSASDFWQYQPRGFSHRGDELIYPASIVKLFYVVAWQEWLEKGMAQPSRELERAMQDAIVDSSNDATSLLVDVLSGTTSGPELPEGPFATWQQQRNIVNRYFRSWGWPELANINVNQKPWGDGPYGRERAFVGEMYDNRNMLTTNATARLFHGLVGGVAVSPTRSQTVLDLLQRDLALGAVVPSGDEENQVNGFLGAGLPAGSKLWSKAGWTSQARHDAAVWQSPTGAASLLVVYTIGQAQNRELLPFVGQRCAEYLADTKDSSD